MANQLPAVALTPIPVMSINREMLKKSPPVYIYNVGPEQHIRPLGGLGTFVVPACPKSEKVSPPLVITGIYPEQINAGEQIVTNYMPGEDIAKDIVGTESTLPGLHEFTTNLAYKGVFISMNPEPTAAEIAAAQGKRREWLQFFVADGDRRSLLGPGENGQGGIGPNHRNAVHELKLKRSWAEVVLAQDECPACGSLIKPGVAICAHCRAILDRKKAEKFGLIPPETEPTKPAKQPNAS